MELEFFGAAGEITGSCHILRVGGRQILLDCGLIQGGRRDEARNRDPFPFQAAQIDAVVLSHAHIDHSGRLPLLVKRGFAGPVFTHRATADLCQIMLRDSASLAERDAERENRRRARQGRKAIKPLYDVADADEACALLRGIPYGTTTEVAPGVNVTFHDAGHIMGSASVRLELSEGGQRRTLVFSGDLGQYDTPILRDPEVMGQADIVLMESTYGGRRHRDRAATVSELGEILTRAAAAGGVVLIPAFAIGRSQELLYWFGKNYSEWGMDGWRIFLDSPMAIAASHVYWDYPHLYDEEATKLRRETNAMPPLPNLSFTESAQESMRINEIDRGAIVIAGSGMCTGGRIVHHLKHKLWREQTQVIIVGYQAPGTLGRRLVERREYVRIHGQTIRVAAQIHTLGGFSAHGDEQDLCRWYQGFDNRPPVFLVHGEPDAAQALQSKLTSECDARVTLPAPGLRINLSDL